MRMSYLVQEFEVVKAQMLLGDFHVVRWMLYNHRQWVFAVRP